MRFNNPTHRDYGPTHLVNGFLRLGYCAALLGKRESGKSDLATGIALAVAEGNPFAGMPVARGGVLWLSSQDPYDHGRSLRPIHDRLENLPFFVTYDRPAIDTSEGLAAIRVWISKGHANLVVVDELDAFHSRGFGWNAREALAPFKRLCFETGVTGLLVKSLRTKAKPEIEAAYFAEATDLAIYLHSALTNKGRAITLKASGRGDDSCWQRKLLSQSPFEYQQSMVTAPAFTRRLTLDDEVLASISKAPYGVSATQISARLDRNPNSIRNAIARLAAAGKIRFSHHAKGSRHYRIHQESAPR
ncbi:MAG: AAA family ATPase [Fimbriimonadales bacterium]